MGSVEDSGLGVVVLDQGLAEPTLRAVESCRAQSPRPRVLVVETGGACPPLPVGVEGLELPANVGYAAGMNAGIERLLQAGCRAVLLLNNDARLDPGCLARLAAALEGPGRAAAGPVVLRSSDARVESRGAWLDLRGGRFRLRDHGSERPLGAATEPVGILPGVAPLLSRAALERVGPLDAACFYAFEDVDWSLRARAAGFELVVVGDAFVRHDGSRTLGSASPDRLYYAVRNHLTVVERHAPLPTPRGWARRVAIVAFHLAHALRPGGAPRAGALAAVAEGVRDFARGRSGARPVAA
jgi:GT2 family glycosyltransferase